MLRLAEHGTPVVARSKRFVRILALVAATALLAPVGALSAQAAPLPRTLKTSPRPCWRGSRRGRSGRLQETTRLIRWRTTSSLRQRRMLLQRAQETYWTPARSSLRSRPESRMTGRHWRQAPNTGSASRPGTAQARPPIGRMLRASAQHLERLEAVRRPSGRRQPNKAAAGATSHTPEPSRFSRTMPR